MFRGSLFSMSMNVFLGLFFMVNEKAKRKIQTSIYFSNRPKTATLVSTGSLSFIFAILYSPFYVVRTWLLLDINSGKSKMSSLETFKTIKQRLGYKGFYRGFLPTLIMGLNGTLTVCTNDLLKTMAP